MKLAISALCILAILVGCSKQENSHSDAEPKPESSVSVEPAPPPKKEFATLAEAIEATKPLMADTQNDISPGAAILALWAADRLTWQDVQNTPRTKYALVMKDSEEQKGKSICASGQIIEIAAEKAQDKKIYSGGLFDEAGRIYRFIAVKSTGELVAQSHTTICGIVTGRQSYQNSIGGVAHAILMVGIFNLPENKN